MEIYPKHMNTHNVINIDFSRMPDICTGYQQYITDILEGLREDLEETYPNLAGKTYSKISEMLRDKGDSFIFILDEWDSVFYRKFMSEEEKDSYLYFLKSLLKDQPYVELAYMTGVLPIAKYSSGSELNMFREHNFMNDITYDNFFGFSETEVRELCTHHKSVSYEELEKWYHGYLKIPNHELMEKYQRVLARDSMGEVKEIVGRSKKMLNATLDCDEKKVAEILEAVHDKEVPF